jgi:hypothetical protein
MASHSPQERTFVSDARSLLIQSVISTTVLPLSGVQSLPAPDKKKKKWRTELRLVRSWNMGTAAGWRGFLFAPTLCHRPLILRSPAHARGASPLVGQIASVHIIGRLTHTPHRPRCTTSAVNWAGLGQSSACSSCFVPNEFEQTKLKRFLGRVVPARSVKTVVQSGPKPRRAFLDRAGSSPAHIFDHIKSKYCNHIKFIAY